MAEIGTHWRVLRSISMVISLSFLLASMFVAAERRSFRLQTSTYYYTPSQESGVDYYISHLSQFLWQSNQSSYRHVWPGMKFGWQIVLGTIIGFFGAAFGSVGGVGGGGIFVPMLNLIIGFDAKSATAISKCMIMGGAASTVYYNLKLRHPTLDMPIIDYDLALLVQPMLMLGISIGVAFNVIFAYWMVTILLIILFIGTSTKAFLKGVETWKKETIMKKDAAKRLKENGNVREETEYKLLGGPSNDNQNKIKDVEPEVVSSAPVPTPAPAKKQVCIPSILQPISIITEAQQRRDQAGVTADLEFMPPENAQALEQVIQATGVRVDAQIRKRMKERAAEEAAVEPSKSPPSPKDKSVSSSISDKSGEEMTMEDISSTMMVMPTVIVVPIPQATDTIEAAPTEGVDIVKDKQGVLVEVPASTETTVEETVEPQKVQETTGVTKPEATPPASIQETIDIPLVEQSTMAVPTTAFEAAIPEIVEEMPIEPPATTVFPPIVETATQKEIEKEKDTAADIPQLSPTHPVARTSKFENNTATCSIAYWVLNSLQIPVSVGVSLYEAIGLYKGKRVIASRGDTGNDLKVLQLFFYCSFGILAGVVGGLLGLGGGFILGPLFLELGVPPEVSSATATFVMVFSSSMSVVEYYLLKRFPVPYALYFIAVATIAAFIGQHVVRKLINILGRASLIIFILAFTIFVSAIALGGVGISNMIRKFQHHGYMGFENLCTYKA